MREKTILIVTRLHKLPKNCAQCHYYIPRFKYVSEVSACSAMNERAIKGKANAGRQEWCPLVESYPCKTIIDTRDQEV